MKSLHFPKFKLPFQITHSKFYFRKKDLVWNQFLPKPHSGCHNRCPSTAFPRKNKIIRSQMTNANYWNPEPQFNLHGCRIQTHLISFLLWHSNFNIKLKPFRGGAYFILRFVVSETVIKVWKMASFWGKDLAVIVAREPVIWSQRFDDYALLPCQMWWQVRKSCVPL